MSYNTKSMLRDQAGNLIPQVYDPVLDDYQPLSQNDVVGVKTKNVDFQVSASVTGVGTKVKVDGAKKLIVDLTGSYVGLELRFRGWSYSVTSSFPLVGVNRTSTDLNLATQTDGLNNTEGPRELWEFDIAGLEDIAMQITAISSGAVSVRGRLVW